MLFIKASYLNKQTFYNYPDCHCRYDGCRNSLNNNRTYLGYSVYVCHINNFSFGEGVVPFKKNRGLGLNELYVGS